MAQATRVISGDPASVAAQLNTLAATEELLIIEKTFSAGDYIVVSDDTAGTGQNAIVLKGDPNSIAALMPAAVDIVCPTFSASQYLVVES